jgi:hypothetical protein
MRKKPDNARPGVRTESVEGQKSNVNADEVAFHFKCACLLQVEVDQVLFGLSNSRLDLKPLPNNSP